ncbi:transcriptional regulator [Candidatus Micrarchaeota archaeon CG10_big_fil_rev_8_21_14_0_10_45_29]|nr:MAG: transcriptional regulator [Candidatus Micrarchaeota archaeon CG10_big_fil_rev_8_21_14_0_10_45_29]
MEKLKYEMAGEIALSPNPGSTMKKWREIFAITQTDLANFLNLSCSTISDYEGNRRKSPGTTIISRFVDALFEIDRSRGSPILSKLSGGATAQTDQYFETHEFATSISAIDFAKLINAKVAVNEELMSTKKIYGYTLMDSLKVILDMPFSQFHKLYGTMSERAFLFTKVSTGRSPMVVIRVTPMKPSLVILHGIDEVDTLALKIAQREQIPVLTTKTDLSRIREALNKL